MVNNLEHRLNRSCFVAAHQLGIGPQTDQRAFPSALKDGAPRTILVDWRYWESHLLLFAGLVGAGLLALWPLFGGVFLLGLLCRMVYGMWREGLAEEFQSMDNGQRTYEAYGAYLLERGWQGIWPPWDELTPLMHAAWDHAAQVAREES